MGNEETTWLAREIFQAFPESVSGLVFYEMDCGCIYYQRKFFDGEIDHQVGIYRDALKGPCDICSAMDQNWKDRVVDETVVYNSRVSIG